MKKLILVFVVVLSFTLLEVSRASVSEIRTIEKDYINLTNNIRDNYNGMNFERDVRLEKTNEEANKYLTENRETARKTFELVSHTQDNNETVEKGITSLTNIIEKIFSNFDKKVKFPLLYETINEIEKYADDYQGSARNKLLNLRHFNPIMRKIFQETVAPVFEWCSKGNLDDLHNISGRALFVGEEKALRSINFLKLLLLDRVLLQRALNVTLNDVLEDYSPNGFYGKQGQQMMNGLEEKLRNAIQMAPQEDMHLDEDETNLYAFIGLFESGNDVKELINLPPNLPRFQKLAKACHDYKIWFESGLKEYAQRHGEVESTSEVPAK